MPTPLSQGSLPIPAAAVVGDIETFLQQVVADLAPDATEPKPGRPRILPALALWGGLVVCVLRGFVHQTALWRLLSQHGLWDYPRFPVSDQAVYTRLARGGTAALEHLFGQVTAVLATRLTPYAATDLAPFAVAVVALDETTLDPVARTLPALRGTVATDARRLPGKLAGVFDLRRQQWRTIQHLPDPRQNEKVAAWTLLDTLVAGTLVVADLGYFGFAWFDALTTRGLHWVSRPRAKTSFTVLHTFYEQGATFDGLVWLGVYRADRAAHAVRLVRYRQGATTYTYLTNVLDPTLLPLREVARLYARRWDIELAFKTVKRHLGLHLLWSAQEGVILQQVWAVLTISQILQALQLEIAGRAGVDPFEVSLALLVAEAPRYAREGRDPVAAFVDHGRAAGYPRPSRRTVIRAPSIPSHHLTPLPADLCLVRSPRYAGRDAGPRSRSPSTVHTLH
jgi:hypothetical protein